MPSEHVGPVATYLTAVILSAYIVTAATGLFHPESSDFLFGKKATLV
jgi:hypothetical protein